MQIPQMAVILIIAGQRGRGARCLQSILDQSNIDDLEVLLLDNAAATEGSLPGSDHPSVRNMALPPVRSYGDAVYYGIKQARAPIIALLEEHCIAYPGWAEALIKAHQGSYAIVSGEIHNGNPGCGASDTIFYSEYWSTLAPRPRGETTHIIVHNSTYKRDILLQFGEELRDMSQSQLMMKWRLEQMGYKFYSEPDAKIAHANESSIRSHWVGLFLSNWSFGAARARIDRWSILRRAFYVLIVPLAPWVRLGRQYVYISKERPELLSPNLRNAPVLWSFHLLAVLGQAVGLIMGEQNSGERFLFFETHEYRPIDGVKVEEIYTPLRG